MNFLLTTLDATGSTNDDVASAARSGAAEGTAVFARQQTAGRGRQGRVWQSPPGNVSLSLLLRPPPQLAPVTGQLAFVAGLAVGETIGSFGCSWQLKWPNDVLVAGRKISGILLESEPGWVVAGMGINVRHAPPVTEKPVTSLLQEGMDVQPETVIERLLPRFAHWYQLWIESGFSPVREEWLKYAYNLRQPVKVALANGNVAEGVFDNLDADGALLLGANGRTTRILAGDVFFA